MTSNNALHGASASSRSARCASTRRRSSRSAPTATTSSARTARSTAAAACRRRRRVILSTRAHEPLYNIGEIIDAYRRSSRVAAGRAARRRARRLADAGAAAARRDAAGRVEFAGILDRAAFRDALAEAEVFVSVPSSDGTSVALLQAMAAGAFPDRLGPADAARAGRATASTASVVPVRIARTLADAHRAGAG